MQFFHPPTPTRGIRCGTLARPKGETHIANKSLTVIARIKAKPGKEQDLKAALEALVPPTLKEEGCLNYDLHEGKDDPQLFMFHENWTNKEMHARHMRSSHLEDFKARMDDLLAEPLQVDLVEAV